MATPRNLTITARGSHLGYGIESRQNGPLPSQFLHNDAAGRSAFSTRGNRKEAAKGRNGTCPERAFQDASEEPGFPLLGLALALCGSNRLSSLVRRPKRRRQLPVPPLLGNCCDHPEGDEVLP